MSDISRKDRNIAAARRTPGITYARIANFMPVVVIATTVGCHGDPRGTVLSPPPGSTLTASTATFRWKAPSDIGDTQFWLDVGTQEGQGDIFAAHLTTREQTVANLPLLGKPIYVRLWTFVNGSRQSPRDFRYETKFDPGYRDLRAKITNPEPESILESTATFRWNPVPQATNYWLDVGNNLGRGDIYGAYQGAATERTVGNLPQDGRMIYVRLWTFINDSRLQPVDYTYHAARANGEKR
jgi:hypothetical protein